ncbi:hypothetical protein BDZ88DRAFT_477015 [Geranomyces variabilis]|nr:hypothetical protein BDZ88DRAFT_477015 [Geranomyces variabilis]KAJ3143320.1 hypothetical protein HDU90_000078 [Geranomyces variabilis]
MLLSSALTALLAISSVAAQLTPARRFGLLKDTRPELGFVNYSPQQKADVAHQAKELLAIYVHEHVKKENYHVDAQKKIAAFEKKAKKLSHKDFHYGLADIFLSLRDFHTNYYIAGPHSCYGFVGPFTFDFVDSRDIANDPRIVVRAITINPDVLRLAKDAVAHVQPGDVLTKIDGLSFVDHWKKTQDHTGGANLYGGYRAALGLLSSINGKIYPAPKNDFINFEFTRPGTPAPFNVTVPWITAAKRDCLADAPSGGQAFGAPKFHGPKETDIKKIGPIGMKPTSPLDGLDLFPEGDNDLILQPTASSIVQWTVYTYGGANLGVLRLSSFLEDGQPDTSRAEAAFRSLLLNELAETDGIVIDLRSNGGGSLNLADGLPQLFVPDFMPGTGRALRVEENRVLFVQNQVQGEVWAASYNASKPGDLYTKAIQFNTQQQTNELGQLYLKPVALLNNANCYSACDTFSASMQDHGILVYGEDGQSGAGGANVVEHRSFLQKGAPTIYKPLPFQDVDAQGRVRLGAPDMRIAWRATIRVKKNEGQLIEDRGVITDRVIRPFTADFTTNVAEGKDTRYSRIAKELRDWGVHTKTTGLFFQSPLNVTQATTGSALSFAYTSQFIKKLEIRDSTNQVVGTAAPSPYYRRTTGQLASAQPASALGRFTYTILGYSGEGKQVLKTKRDSIITPGLDKYVKVAAGQTWTYSKNASAAFSAVYNTGATAAPTGWIPSATGIVVGNGVQYVDSVDTSFSVFANVPAGAKLSTTFAYDTEKDYDFLTISVRSVSAGTAPVVLFTDSGAAQVDKAFDLGVSGNVEITYHFVSDGGVTAKGVTVSKIAIQA